MNTDHINIPEDDFNEGLEDIEQLLKPQCEFKASDTLKEEVLAQAREEIKPRRKVNPWGGRSLQKGPGSALRPRLQQHDVRLPGRGFKEGGLCRSEGDRLYKCNINM